MQDRPEAADLLDAIADFLKKQVLPAVRTDDALGFKTLVSWNMLGVVAREIRDGGAATRRERERLMNLFDLRGDDVAPEETSAASDAEAAGRLRRRLAEKIRAEKIHIDHPEIWAAVRESVHDRVRLANPRFSMD